MANRKKLFQRSNSVRENFWKAGIRGRVYNDVMGLVDAGIVQYLIDRKAISRRYVKKDSPGSYWAVGPDLKAYEDFYQKNRTLDELKDKRAYAEQKNKESFDALIESRNKLIESTKI